MRSWTALWKLLGGTGQDTGIPAGARLTGPLVHFAADKSLPTDLRTATGAQSGIAAAADVLTLTIATDGWYYPTWCSVIATRASPFLQVAFIIRGNNNSAIKWQVRLVPVVVGRPDLLVLPYPLWLLAGDTVVIRTEIATIAGDDIQFTLNLVRLYQE